LISEKEGVWLRGIRGAIQVEKNEREYILKAAKELLTKVVSENHLKKEAIVSAFFTATPEHISVVGEVADIFQIGTRNMQNYALLEAVGRSNKPVLLKRGMMATLEEFLMAAEYILSNGNSSVILCERGIRTFEKYTKNTLDLTAIPLLNQLSHLPVCIDPSHGTGMSSLVLPASKAAVAAFCRFQRLGLSYEAVFCCLCCLGSICWQLTLPF